MRSSALKVASIRSLRVLWRVQGNEQGIERPSQPSACLDEKDDWFLVDMSRRVLVTTITFGLSMPERKTSSVFQLFQIELVLQPSCYIQRACGFFAGFFCEVGVEGFEKGKVWDFGVAEARASQGCDTCFFGLLMNSRVSLVFPLPASPETKTVILFLQSLNLGIASALQVHVLCRLRLAQLKLLLSTALPSNRVCEF